MGADAASVEFMPLETETLVRWSQEARARARATREQIRRGRLQRERLQDLVIARLRARLETMPVIEQAKGVIVAQQGCGPDEAFELLRRVSQHSNVKVHELAARIVEQAASGSRRGNGLPSRGGAARPVRPEPRARPPGAANGPLGALGGTRTPAF